MRRFFEWLADRLAPKGWQDGDGFHLGDATLLPPDFHSEPIGATPEALRERGEG